MAARYAKTAGGNWSSANTWSATSPAGVDNAGAPTSADDAILLLASGNVTIDATSVCKTLDCTTYTGTLTHGAFTLTVSGSVTLVAGMTYAPGITASTVLALAATGTLTSGGKVLPKITMGTGTFTLGDNIQIGDNSTFSGDISIFPGTLVPNGKKITVTNIGGTRVIDCPGTTFYDLTLINSAVKTAVFNFTGAHTVSNTLTITGNSSINRILVSSNTVGTSRTLTAATVSVSNTDFQDITGAGAGSWDFSARTDIGNCQGNTGITFPASISQTWSGTSSGNWSTNSWTTRVPLPQDDVSLGVAFSASQTVTADMPRLGRSIDWTGATGSGLTWANSVSQSIYGSLTLISGLTISGTNTLTLSGRGNFTITSAGIQFTQPITLTAFGGTYSLSDALTMATSSTNGNLSLTNGTFTTNNFTVTCSNFATSSSGILKTINTGTSIFNFTQTIAGSVWSVFSGLTLNDSGAKYIITTASASTRTFAGNGLSYGTLTYTVAGSTGELDITGANSFAQINFSDSSNARSLKFTKATTTTIRNGDGFNVRGTSGKKMTLDTVDGAGVFTLTSPSRQASMDYITPTRSTVDASPAWYAGVNSNDGGTTTNWIFTNAPYVIRGSRSAVGLQAKRNIQNIQRLG